MLALLAALYAVLTPVQRSRLSLSWLPQLLVAVPACATILAFELFDIRPPGCPVVLGGLCRYLTLGSADPGPARKFAFLIAFVWLLVAIEIHRRARSTLRRLPQLTELASTLIDEEQFDDAIKLVESHLPLIAKAARRKCRAQIVHDWLKEFGPIDRRSFAFFARPPGRQPWRGENAPEWIAKRIRQLARFVPVHARAEAAARNFIQILLRSNRLLDYIVVRRPHFGVILLRLDAYGEREFLDRYLTRLISAPGSALYQELADNQISSGSVGYELPERNRLLHFLFADPTVAERLSAWKPVGDYVKRLLAGKERQDYWEFLNGDPSGFEPVETDDPVWNAMFFFDIMVTSAARHGIEYHMWLLYLPRFAERIEARYDSSDDGIDRDAEFPNRAARLLYELVNFLRSWIEIFKRLPSGSPLRTMPERQEDAARIPHAAAAALGNTLAIILASNRIDDGVIQLLHDVSMRAVREFHDDDETGPMRRYVIEAIFRADNSSPPEGHLFRLRDRFIRLDSYDQFEMSDYADALNAAIAARS